MDKLFSSTPGNLRATLAETRRDFAGEITNQSLAPDKAIIIAGPTGCGKSALALDVAQSFFGDIVNSDSMQVYKELRILTSRPSTEDELRAPHHLFGYLPASEACSAGQWTAMAEKTLATIAQNGRLPIITGGTGFYLKSLLSGLAPIPPIPEDIRRWTRERFDVLGGEVFRAELSEFDPIAANVLPVSDRQRLMRAHEVFHATGKPLAYWHQCSVPAPLQDTDTAIIAFVPDRQTLYDSLDQRFHIMLTQGGFEEAENLFALDLPETLPAMKAVGVKQLLDFQRGRITYDIAITNAKRDTRRYAKRQLTWLRHQLNANFVVEAQYSESMKAKIFTFIRQFLLTGSK
jgi:tRNA dimethylallyltransferase